MIRPPPFSPDQSKQGVCTMRFVLATLVITGSTLLVACGGSTNRRAATPLASAANASAATLTKPSATNTPTPTASATATEPAATATPVVAPSPAASQPRNTPEPPTPTEEVEPAPPAPSGGTITLVAVNVLFNVSLLSAPPGPVTVTLDNQDHAIAHNVHFFSRASGQSIGATEVEPGPATESLTLGTLAPGAYLYKCDVHPTTMMGILTVS